MDKKLKVVVDTNALLQMLGRHSKYHFLYEKFLNEEYWLCVSNEIVHEYEEILEMLASPEAANLFMKVLEFSENVVRKDPFFKLNLIKKDPDDNKFVDCAFASQADYIVTNDAHFLELKQVNFPTIQVKSLDDFALDMG
ncbi:MAG: putative toxin-antitoxin system toxin component, PIN family [Fibrobacter sp.]|uniref:putative toxin-antitoxin system toxin component, PIN family n=1 Tax=Fibrobacter sp. TaxID=35828 RepID=UPI0025BA9D27|nr:putative toxin-antitoxin system toxin component, PIN family [Fibrobacter sp.]MBQ7079355.1 putative toxin-antitoxin system toxin component, PIN family [Fibrobacter sp.]